MKSEVIMKDPPRIMPAVIVPAGQSATTQTMHLGAVIAEPWAFDANSIRVMAGADLLSSIVEYWVFDVGYWRAGVWTTLVTTSTKPIADGGLGDLKAGHWYEIKHPSGALEWGDVLGVIATPTGSPAAPCMLFAMSNPAIVQ